MTAGLQGRGVVSRLTRAVLQDCGWYSLSNDFSEPLVWGKGAGCGFALKFCHEQLSFNEYRFFDMTHELLNFQNSVFYKYISLFSTACSDNRIR